MPTAPGQRQPRQRSKQHKGLIARLPSVISGAPGPSIVAHVRFADAAHKKPITGMAAKPSDCWTVPLAHLEHVDHEDAQHRHNEREWWEAKGIPVLDLCRELYAASPDFEAMEAIVERYRLESLMHRNPPAVSTGQASPLSSQPKEYA
nr:hypothetical protein DBT41_09570 [Aerococcus urinae]